MAKDYLKPETLARNTFWLAIAGIAVYMGVVFVFIL